MRAFLRRLVRASKSDGVNEARAPRASDRPPRDSQATLKAFMDHAPEALSLKDADGRYLMVNAAFADLAGVAEEAILGKSDSDLGVWLEPSIQQAIDAHERAVLDSATSINQERVGTGQDGSPRAWMVTKFPVLDKHGDAIAVGTINVDMSEGKRTEQALRESEESFRRLIQGSIQGIVILREAKPLFANEAFADILGFSSPEEVLELESLESVFAPHERPRLRDYALARERGDYAPTHYEFDALRKDGSSLTLQSVVSATIWDSAPAIQVAVIDVTERRRIVEALRVAASGVSAATGTAFFRLLVRYLADTLHAQVAYIAKLNDDDPDRIDTIACWANSVHCEHQAYPLSGTPDATVVGDSIRVYSANVRSHFPHDARLAESGIECFVGMPLAASDGRPLGLLAVMYDSAQRETELAVNLLRIFGTRAVAEFERLSTERALRELNDELERRVANRTAQLQSSNKELETLTYSVSHNLRAPLRHLIAYVELLRREIEPELDSDTQRYLDTVAQSARRMGMLTDDLLAFTQIGRAEIRRSAVDLGRLVDKAINDLDPKTRSRWIDWRVDSLPTVHGDPTMLGIVMSSLIHNAVKFTRGCPAGRIEIGWLPDKSSGATLFVRDNGVGFDMKYADKLFGVFQRLHGEGEFDGVGMGLAKVKRIVERHGGSAWAESTPGHGATFYVSFPD